MTSGVLTVNSARAPWTASAEKRATERRVEYIVMGDVGRERSRELKGGGRVDGGESETGRGWRRRTRCERKAKAGTLPA